MIRKEEIRKAASEYIVNNSIDEYIQISDCKDSFIEGAKWADNHPKSPWINSKNKLPTKGGCYLCFDENHYISTFAFNGNRWINTATLFDVSLDVVKYWMPIPKLPKDE